MSNLLESIKEKVSEDKGKEKEQINEFKDTKSNIMGIIKELGDVEFSSGKKKSIMAAKKIMQVAESNDAMAKSFMRGLDKATTKIGKVLHEKFQKGFFEIKK